jgi:hypothetical protein
MMISFAKTSSITCLHFASAGRHLNKSRGGKEEMNERACNKNSGTGYFGAS